GSGANAGVALGGAVFNHNGVVSISDSTIAGNPGGGVYNRQQDGTATLTIANSILANSGVDCTNDGGTVTAPVANRNLIETNAAASKACGVSAVTGDPQLSSQPFDFGGPTLTMSIPRTSPAYDAGLSALSVDQRGEPRPGSGSTLADIGAFELQLPVADVSVTKTGPATAEPGSNITYSITVSNAGPGEGLNTVLTDVLPTGLLFVSLVPGVTTDAPDSCSVPSPFTAGTVTCTWNSLAAGTSAAFALTAQAGAGFIGNASNTATVTTDSVDPTTPSSATALTVVGCTNSITGSHAGFAAGSGTWCVSNANIAGNISASGGARIFIANSTVSGSVTANGTGRVALCGSTVGGGVSVSGATGFVQIGDPEFLCAGNAVASSVQLTNNTAGVELSGNTRIGGHAIVTGNSGTGPTPDAPAQEIEANRILGNLSCSGNTPAVTNSGQPNIVTFTRSGQCATL
ncbi:MAG TPA: DUF11 domain-containing protein, partial [Acidimicrobiales bacterium]|nr:DUF11 domain-containing protein [Acidimicrobiales bacterium]